MNPNTQNNSWRIKNDKPGFVSCLFLCTDWVLLCSESTIRRLNIRCFSKHSFVFFQWSCARFLQGSFFESFTAELNFLFSSRNSNRFYCRDKSFSATKLFLKNSNFWLSSISSMQHVRGKNLLHDMAEQLLVQSCFLTLIEASFISRLVKWSSESCDRVR